jgi:hypothetical protein
MLDAEFFAPQAQLFFFAEDDIFEGKSGMAEGLSGK